VRSALLADMLLNAGGAVHAREQVDDWLAASGLELESSRRVLAYTRLWIASKRA
jgi:hypothetical protein